VDPLLRTVQQAALEVVVNKMHAETDHVIAQVLRAQTIGDRSECAILENKNGNILLFSHRGCSVSVSEQRATQ
jgi:hypothetical protein